MPAVYDLTSLIDSVEAIVKRHNLGKPGAYSRWSRLQEGKPQLDLGLNPYGCADAANILYTIGRFPRDPAERQGWVAVLQGLQDPKTGLFHEATHHDFHCTAHCTAALELFDAAPAHPLKAMHPLLDPRKLEAFLDGLPWVAAPWPGSHQGAGIYAALVIAGEATPAWEDAYFEWLWREIDPATGFWRKGCVPPNAPPETKPIFHHLGGSFHYLFNHEAAHRPLRYPEKMIDTCLDLWERDLHAPLGREMGFAEADWVYCVNRAGRQAGAHRTAARTAALRAMADRLIDKNLRARDFRNDPAVDDLHNLFGTLCALAELQQAVPGLIRTERPLKLVLDRRPFI